MFDETGDEAIENGVTGCLTDAVRAFSGGWRGRQ